MQARPVRRFAASVILVAVVACGGGDPDAGAPVDATEPFVPPRDADVLVADLHWEGADLPGFGEPTNLTQRPGYDNQPHFVPDGSGLWYTAVDEMSGQSDIWRVDFADRRVTRVTMSAPESEYSATPLPDGSGISAIRVEADSAQRLWRFDADGSNGAVVFEDIAPVGYHKWSDANTVVMFVLGSPATLQRGDVRSGTAEVLASDIGRSIQVIPGGRGISYVQRASDGSTTVMRLPADGSAALPIIDGVGGGDFHAWAPNGTLLMAEGAIVHGWTWGEEASWTPVADFSDLHIRISRLAVSPNGSQIAMVAEIEPIRGIGQ